MNKPLGGYENTCPFVRNNSTCNIIVTSHNRINFQYGNITKSDD